MKIIRPDDWEKRVEKWIEDETNRRLYAHRSFISSWTPYTAASCYEANQILRAEIRKKVEQEHRDAGDFDTEK